jgi:hypothetical protein
VHKLLTSRHSVKKLAMCRMPDVLTPAKLRLAMAAMGKPETNVGRRGS